MDRLRDETRKKLLATAGRMAAYAHNILSPSEKVHTCEEAAQLALAAAALYTAARAAPRRPKPPR